jgi:hypothetical protein
MCYQEEAYHDGLWVQFDGFRPMKRPSSGDARSAPARCVKQVGKEECRAPSFFGLDCEGTLAFDFMSWTAYLFLSPCLST